MTILTKDQKKTFTVKNVTEDNEQVDIVVQVRYDDQCGNGHNSFAITGTIYETGKRGDRATISCGCVHDAIARHFPDLAHLIDWHLTSSDGPMHYVANTMYHASSISKHQDKFYLYAEDVTLKSKKLIGIHTTPEIDAFKTRHPNMLVTTKECFNPTTKEPDLKAARSCAVWPDATLDQLQDKALLESRLPQLLKDFRAAVESLGFIY